ncbi:MAG: HIT family protein [Candidatus Lokiarchaeota archaeon]|nr:HIT family protein [Candidatus Lokiarchaeota archaeon]
MPRKGTENEGDRGNPVPDCIFCKIVAGTIPSRKFYEDDAVIGFLDINPAAPGHTLVVPKQHFKLIVDGTEEQVQKAFIGVRNVAGRLRSKLGCNAFNILVNQGREAGQAIEHFHVHIIPRVEGDGMRVNPPDRKMKDPEMDQILSKLR